MYLRYRFVVGVALVLLLADPGRAVAAAYAFAGMSTSNFIAFWEDSVDNPSDLSQGPNRDGTGAQVNRNDLGSAFGGGSGGGWNVAFERTRTFGGIGNDSPQACVGDCSKGQNDFSRPPSLPATPSGAGHFARADSRHAGDFFGFGNAKSSYAMEMVAELGLQQVPMRNPSEASGVAERSRFFQVTTARAMVIDFDVDLHLRTFNGVVAPNTMLAAESIFIVSLRSGTEDILRFSPNESGNGNLGGTVIAAPFALNRILTVPNPAPLDDREVAPRGQFRVITPVLEPGKSYVLEVEQRLKVTTANVPEPHGLYLVCGALVACASKLGRRR